jgi:hypothetical protein
MGATLFLIGILTGYCLCLYTHRNKAGKSAGTGAGTLIPEEKTNEREEDQVN